VLRPVATLISTFLGTNASVVERSIEAGDENECEEEQFGEDLEEIPVVRVAADLGAQWRYNAGNVVCLGDKHEEENRVDDEVGPGASCRGAVRKVIGADVCDHAEREEDLDDGYGLAHLPALLVVEPVGVKLANGADGSDYGKSDDNNAEQPKEPLLGALTVFFFDLRAAWRDSLARPAELDRDDAHEEEEEGGASRDDGVCRGEQRYIVCPFSVSPAFRWCHSVDDTADNVTYTSSKSEKVEIDVRRTDGLLLRESGPSQKRDDARKDTIYSTDNIIGCSKAAGGEGEAQRVLLEGGVAHCDRGV